MIAAKPVSLTVRPLQVSHLCFEVGGILGKSFVELGDAVPAFNFGELYQAFRDATLASDEADGNGRLRFDSAGIDHATHIQPEVADGPALAALRAEPLKAALNKAVAARANAFLTKYRTAAFTIAATNGVLQRRQERLERVVGHVDNQTNLLDNAYVNDDRSGVVKSTKSVISPQYNGTSTTTQENGNSSRGLRAA